MTCPNPDIVIEMAKIDGDSGNFLQVPDSNLLLVGDQDKGFKSVSLNNLSTDSIKNEDGQAIKFPSSSENSKNRLKKQKFGISELEEKTVFVKNRNLKRRNTNFVKETEIKLTITQPTCQNEEIKVDESQERIKFYAGSNGDSTPHLYVDYQSRLKGILLKLDDNDDLLLPDSK